MRFNQATNGDTYRVNATTMYPSHGTTWMHVAATYDGTTIRLYVNGVQEGQLAASIPIPTNNLALGIAAQPDGLFGVLQGTMDDVLLYNTALTASEIAALAAIPPVTRCSWARATSRVLGRTIRPRASSSPVFPATCSRSETSRTRPAPPPSSSSTTTRGAASRHARGPRPATTTTATGPRQARRRTSTTSTASATRPGRPVIVLSATTATTSAAGRARGTSSC